MRRAAALILIAAMIPTPAFAHSSARGFVLLLPTHYVVVGGTLAVLVTFAAISALPDHVVRAAVNARMKLGSVPVFLSTILSLLSFVVLIVLIWIGFAGPHDPVENLLSLAIWTIWWVVIVLLHPLFGNIWSAVNPFSGLHFISGAKHKLNFPKWLDYIPALVIFAAFAWFHLVYPAPEDPSRLAIVVSIYVAITMMAIFLYGPEAWLSRGDPFGVFMSQLGAAAPIAVKKQLQFCVPGAGLVLRPALPIAGTMFVLLTLSTISFDGFANTFLWLSAIGINPLDYPGRTALIIANSFGLVALTTVLSITYFACIAMGWYWAGKPASLTSHMGRFALSLIPISIAYHFAHYLSDLLVNLQYLALALNDPFGNGSNLLNLSQYHVTASFQNTSSGTLAIYTAQTCAIIAGHVISVATAHAIAVQAELPQSQKWKLELPLTIFMLAFTAFGLWLLSTPSIS